MQNKSIISNTTESKIPQLLLRVLGGYLSVAGLFGLITDGASLFVFYRHTRLRSPTNTFIVGLLCTDLAMCLLEIPFVTSILYTGRLLWKFKLCVLRGELSYFCGLSNMYILAAISLNRYLLITKPLRFRVMKYKTVTGIVSLTSCYIFGLLWSMVPFSGWTRYEYENVHIGLTCSPAYDSTDHIVLSYNIMVFGFCFLFSILQWFTVIIIYSKR
jgi:hypothetical protein